MAFLFKSKKHPDKSQPVSRDAGSGSQGSIQSATARASEKGSLQHRATPTGSLNSIDNDATSASPDQGPGHSLGHGRRGGSADQSTQQPSDPSVSFLCFYESPTARFVFFLTLTQLLTCAF